MSLLGVTKLTLPDCHFYDFNKMSLPNCHYRIDFTKYFPILQKFSLTQCTREFQFVIESMVCGLTTSYYSLNLVLGKSNLRLLEFSAISQRILAVLFHLDSLPVQIYRQRCRNTTLHSKTYFYFTQFRRRNKPHET